MSSYTSSQGHQVYASAEYGLTPAWNAFVDPPRTVGGWINGGLAVLGVVFPTAFIARGYLMYPWWPDAFPGRSPTVWTLEGSLDGWSWTVVDSRSGITWTSDSETKFFPVSTPGSYLFYRLNLTANGGDSYTGLGWFKLQGKAGPVEFPARSTTRPSSRPLLMLPPPLRSATSHPGYVATASTTYPDASVAPWHSFSGITTNQQSAVWLSASVGQPAWIAIALPFAFTVNTYRLQPWWPDSFPTRTPTNWTFEGSNDGATWTILDTRVGEVWPSSTAVRDFSVPVLGRFTNYRLNISAISGVSAYTGLGLFKLIGSRL